MRYGSMPLHEILKTNMTHNREASLKSNEIEHPALEKWLSYIDGVHFSEIELGLYRVNEVWLRMRPQGLSCPVITVGGTNGKGSCVAMLESILTQAGYHIGAYTSPHLLHFNERIRVNGINATDQEIVAAFERVEQARQAKHEINEISLTYFEFALLAALEIFVTAEVDVIVLEVGLGGRLDAVNIIDADVAIVTTVDLDHTDWLGETREEIALEKAGIFRPDRPAVFGSSNPPSTMLEYADKKNVHLLVNGRDYFVESEHEHEGWKMICASDKCPSFDALPEPGLEGEFQRNNGAAVLVALSTLADRLPVSRQAIDQGLQSVSLEGRFQYIAGQPAWLLDVAHNREAACALADNLSTRHAVRRAVFSMLADKPVKQVIDVLAGHIEHWYVAPLDCSRALSLERLSEAVKIAAPQATLAQFDCLEDALTAAENEAAKDEDILVFGSFYTVGGALQWLGERDKVGSS